MPTGGHILVSALNTLGAKRAYCVAGESYLPVLDGFLEYPDIDVVTCRQESGVTFMAETYGALHGAPGIALVTRGPGACNASIGVHTAMQSSTPMILFIGLINTNDRDKEAFQEFDVGGMFGSISKWATVIDKAERIPEYVARAWHVATSGRPGPVVLGLPEDILFPEFDMAATKVIPQSRLLPKAEDMKAIQKALTEARRPLIIAGGSCWSDQACSDLEDFASASHIPVAASFRRHDIFDHTHNCYVGELGTSSNPALIERVKQADVVLVLNARLNEMAMQEYSLLDSDTQNIIHVYPSAEEFGKAIAPNMVVEAHIDGMASSLAGACRVDGRKWAGWRDELRAAYAEWTRIDGGGADKHWKGADMTQVYAFLQEALPKDAVVTTDAGNFSGWAQRYLRYGRPGRLFAPISGAMGYAIPAAVAASMERPDGVSLGICGDGGFMMTSQEIATAMHHGAKPIIMVCNNNIFGTIRMHQDKHYPGRVSATGLTNPDFVKLAESYGAFGVRVSHADDMPAAWEQALNSDTASVIEIVMDPAQSTTRS